MKNCPFTSLDQTLLSPQQLRQLGDLTFTELAELRHRGAFSTVAQTFVVCCMRSNSGAETVGQTLEDWYKVRNGYCYDSTDGLWLMFYSVQSSASRIRLRSIPAARQDCLL